MYLNNNTLNKNSSISNNANISSKVQIKILNNSYIILPSFTTILNATILDDNNNSIIGDKFKFLVNTDEINADSNKNFISAEHTFAQVGLYKYLT